MVWTGWSYLPATVISLKDELTQEGSTTIYSPLQRLVPSYQHKITTGHSIRTFQDFFFLIITRRGPFPIWSKTKAFIIPALWRSHNIKWSCHRATGLSPTIVFMLFHNKGAHFGPGGSNCVSVTCNLRNPNCKSPRTEDFKQKRPCSYFLGYSLN